MPLLLLLHAGFKLKEELLYGTHWTRQGRENRCQIAMALGVCQKLLLRCGLHRFLSLRWPKQITWLSMIPIGPGDRLFPQGSTVDCMAVNRHV